MAIEPTHAGASAFGPGDPSADPGPTGSLFRWLRTFLTVVLYAVIGMMLTALPWLPDWDQNYFSGSHPGWYSFWMNSYFRGAVSGIGVVTLYVGILEVYGWLRGGER